MKANKLIIFIGIIILILVSGCTTVTYEDNRFRIEENATAKKGVMTNTKCLFENKTFDCQCLIDLNETVPFP